MVDITKLDMTNIWASAGDMVAPTASKIATGWVVEAVPRQTWNWFENRQDQNIAYALQKGIPEWDSTTQYIINKSFVQRNGLVYKAIATSTALDPASDTTSWVRAFASYSVSVAALATVTPAADTVPYFNGTTTATSTSLTPFARTVLDDVDAPTMRTTLNAQTLNANLTALSNVVTAVNVLPYFTGVGTAATTTLSSFARTLIDDVDAPTARNTLGLGTVATYNLTTSAVDTTTNSVLKVGDFGLGSSSVNLVTDANNPYTTGFTGFYRAVAGGSNLPVAQAGLITHVQNTTTSAVQFYSSASDASQFYTRTISGGTGSVWTRVWTDTSLVKTASSTDTTAGRMLKVGDFGVGGAVALAAAVDLNTIQTSGTYYASSFTGNNGPTGITTGVVTNLFVEVFVSATYIKQVAYSQAVQAMFSRTYTVSSTSWSAWTEVYTTDNTASLVAQVVTNVTPTLNTKLNIAGGTMTGGLIVPSIEVGVSGTGSSAGFIDFHGAASSSDYDARIGVSGTSSTSATGLLSFLSGGVTFSSGITATALTLSSGINAATGTFSGAVSASSITSVGSITTTGVITSGVEFIVKDTNSNNTTNTQLVFQNYGGTERGLMYVDPSGNIYLRSLGQAATLTLTAARGASFASTLSTAGVISGGGNITAAGYLSSAGNVFAGGVSSFLQTDGNVYGSAWGGYLSSWVSTNYVSYAQLPAQIASYGVGAIGTYAFMYTSTNPGIGGLVAGSNLLYAYAAGQGTTVPAGTWRMMGDCPVGGRTLFLRVS